MTMKDYRGKTPQRVIFLYSFLFTIVIFLIVGGLVEILK